MPVPAGPRAAGLIRAERGRGRGLVNALADASLAESFALLCERASAAVDEYSSGLLARLIAVARPASEADAEWVKRNYLSLVSEFVTAVRDVSPDPETRHAVAQAVQCRILLHERRCRAVLASELARHEVAS